MIESRHRELTFLANFVCLAMPASKALDKRSASSGEQTGIVTRVPHFVVPSVRKTSESVIERQQTWIVWCFMVLLWVLFAVGLLIVWHRAGLS